MPITKIVFIIDVWWSLLLLYYLSKEYINNFSMLPISKDILVISFNNCIYKLPIFFMLSEACENFPSFPSYYLFPTLKYNFLIFSIISFIFLNSQTSYPISSASVLEVRFFLIFFDVIFIHTLLLSCLYLHQNLYFSKTLYFSLFQHVNEQVIMFLFVRLLENSIFFFVNSL